MPISWRRKNDGFIMTYKLKTETFSQKIEHSGGVIVLPLTPLFSFVTFHLNRSQAKQFTQISITTMSASLIHLQTRKNKNANLFIYFELRVSQVFSFLTKQT